MKSYVALSLLLFTAIPVFPAQAPHVPVRLAVEGPQNVARGQTGQLNIKLLDAHGQPFTATKDLKFNIKTIGGKVDHETVVIPKGSSSANVAVTKAAPGVANVQVDSADAANAGLSGATQVGFTPTDGYTPVLPLTLLVSVQPATKLKAGVDTAKVIVRYVDKSNVPVPTKTGIRIDFPEVSDMLTPTSVTIPAGSSFGEADLVAQSPQLLALKAVSSPPIIANPASAEFVSPISATRVIPDHTYVKSVSHPKITLAIGLIDDQGNWISSDQDRILLLQVDPPSAGIFSASSVTIPKGQSTGSVVFTPQQEGVSKIKAVALDIPSPETTFEFYYAAMYFWLIAAIGGLIGGGVRNALGEDHSFKKIAGHLAGGLAIGVIAYLIAPLLVAVSLKPAGLENSSKIFEAFAWGFVGGGSGVTLLGRILAAKNAAENHEAAEPKGEAKGATSK